MRNVLSLAAVFFVSLFAGAAHATVVYSNFGTGDSFDSSVFRFFGPNTTFSDFAQAFELGASDTPFRLDSIDVAVQGGQDGTGINVHFATNLTGGLEPDTILESSSVFVFGSPTIRTAPFSGTTLIDQPGTYWVWLSFASGNVLAGARWFVNDSSVSGSLASRTSTSGPWTTQSSLENAYRINGTPIPVPAALWLFGSALGLLGWARRKRA